MISLLISLSHVIPEYSKLFSNFAPYYWKLLLQNTVNTYLYTKNTLREKSVSPLFYPHRLAPKLAHTISKHKPNKHLLNECPIMWIFCAY